MQEASYITNPYYPVLVHAEELKLQGMHKEAIDLCDQILVHDLTCTEAFEEIGDNYISLKQYSKAKKALEQALKLMPRSANANYLYGFVFSAQHQWEKALEYLEKANDYESNHPEVLRCLGWAIFNSGQRKKGLLVLERALAIAPSDSYVLCDLGVCYMNERDFQRALDLFNKTLEVDPTNIKAKECCKISEMFLRGSQK
jgi:tetratricopeptide (TPR) repeat protein